MVDRHYKFIYSPQVESALSDAPSTVLDAFFALLEGLHAYPFPGTALLGVMDYKENDIPGGGFTAAFDNGLLLFQVMADYPLIRLVQITWL